jgi:hypothetical protein
VIIIYCHSRSPDEVRVVPAPNAPLHVGYLARPIRQDAPVDLFTEMWWNTLKAPLLPK